MDNSTKNFQYKLSNFYIARFKISISSITLILYVFRNNYQPFRN